MKSAIIKKRERRRGATICVVCPHCGHDHWIPDSPTGACRYGKQFKIVDPRR